MSLISLVDAGAGKKDADNVYDRRRAATTKAAIYI
jgi:hypothetical protein